MAEYDFIKMQKKLAKYLDEDRYAHTLGVMYTCAALAMVHNCDLVTAQTAGLLHDCAKCIPNKKKLKMCSQHNIAVSEFEQTHPFLLHAKLGAYVARAKYDVTDEEILSAITWHTTGKPEMTLLEKALAYLGEESVITRDFHTIEQADKVILPGVGSFGVAMDNLKRYELDKVIHEVCERKVPFLGICLGLQLMFEGSEESEGVEGLGLLEGKIVRIPDTYGLKIPHIGWNSLHLGAKGQPFGI